MTNARLASVAEMTSYLIRGVRVVDGEPTDLLLRDGVVAEMGPKLSARGADLIDADGLVALTGLVVGAGVLVGHLTHSSAGRVPVPCR